MLICRLFRKLRKSPKPISLRPHRTMVTLYIDDGDVMVHMHRQCKGTWTETRDDLAAFVDSLKEELANGHLCPMKKMSV